VVRRYYEAGSGWYKRKSQIIIFIVGLILVCAVNADAFTITTASIATPTLRDAVVNATQVLLLSHGNATWLRRTSSR
jgi:hypothetical protein